MGVEEHYLGAATIILLFIFCRAHTVATVPPPCETMEHVLNNSRPRLYLGVLRKISEDAEDAHRPLHVMMDDANTQVRYQRSRVRVVFSKRKVSPSQACLNKLVVTTWTFGESGSERAHACRIPIYWLPGLRDIHGPEVLEDFCSGDWKASAELGTRFRRTVECRICIGKEGSAITAL